VSFRSSAKEGLLRAGWYPRRLGGDDFPGVLVLCYHGIRPKHAPSGPVPFEHLHIDEDTFAGHCEVITQLCHPISLDDWRVACSGGQPLPLRPVLMTFDDGYRNVFEIARPMLNRFKMPAAIFVCSDSIARGRLLWFDAVARRYGESVAVEYRALDYERWRDAVAACDVAASDGDWLAPLTIEQVKALADDGFEIGVHTDTHPILSAAPPDRQRSELSRCRIAVEQWIGRPVTALAYPFGTPRVDYTEETVCIARELGFDVAFTTRADYSRPEEPALERSRHLILSSVSPAEMAHRMTHSWGR
jgi:peptidoglycan/xylan/chitin deacetylase (PgdA/CDA1 family)